MKAISFSRDSEGKEQRLRDWRAANGLLTDEDREKLYGPQASRRLSHHDSEHRINRKHAMMRDGELEIIAGLDSGETAGTEGTRGAELLRIAAQTGAEAVLIPSLRRLGVGVAQVQLRKTLEANGLRIVVTNPKYALQNAILESDPGPTRDQLLWRIAGDDEYEWQVSKERLARAGSHYWTSPQGEAILLFTAARPHLSLRDLAKALEFHRHRTPRGNTHWDPQQVARIRERLNRPETITNPAVTKPRDTKAMSQKRNRRVANVG